MKKIIFFFFSIFLFLKSEINFLGKNLIESEEYKEGKLLQYWEIKKGEGVSIFWDKDIKLSKDGSICILIEKNNSYANIYTPFLQIENKKYFFSIFYKQKWESQGKDKYLGISSGVAIEWYDKDKKLLNITNISRFLYSETDWDLRDAILTPPENSKFVRVRIGISNNSEKQTGKFIVSKLWVDNIQFKEYLPPEDPEYAKDEMLKDIERFPTAFPITLFFPAIDESFKGKGSKWCKVVDDKDAMRGKSIYIPEVGEKGIVFHSPYFSSLPLGLYRFEIRAKVKDIKENISLGYLDISSEKSGTRLFIDFNTNSFKKENEYVSFKDDFIIRDAGWWAIRVYTNGKNDWYIDNIKIIPLLNFSDREIVKIYPKIEGFIEEDIFPRKSKPLKILIFKGLFYEDWCKEEILEEIDKDEKVEIRKIYFERTMGTPKFNELPGDIREIFDNNLIIFAGHQSYIKEAWENSLLKDILPFEIDEVEFFENGIFLKKYNDFLRNIKIDKNISCYYITKIKNLKENCKMPIKCGDYPFLIIGNYYKGKVVCFLGFNLGEKIKDEIPFWEWNKWKNLIEWIILFLTGERK